MADKPPPQEPGAWDRFTHAIDVALHTPPKHRKPKDKPESSPPPQVRKS